MEVPSSAVSTINSSIDLLWSINSQAGALGNFAWQQYTGSKEKSPVACTLQGRDMLHHHWCGMVATVNIHLDQKLWCMGGTCKVMYHFCPPVQMSQWYEHVGYPLSIPRDILSKYGTIAPPNGLRALGYCSLSSQGGVKPGLGFFHPIQTTHPCLISERPTMANNNHAAAVAPTLTSMIMLLYLAAVLQGNQILQPLVVAHTVPLGNNGGGDGGTYF